ncbi:MAG: hypothetical protein HYV27_11475 [Candidatus Hydrogenedentes bacterium]|nr:hypothetical protein [Candidatus Hydrogenedentota bacterium]
MGKPEEFLVDILFFGVVPLMTITMLLKYLLGSEIPQRVEMAIGSLGIHVIAKADARDSNDEKVRLIRWEDIAGAIVFGSDETRTSILRLHTYNYGPILMRCCLGFAPRVELNTHLSARFIVEPHWRYWVSDKEPDLPLLKFFLLICCSMAFLMGVSILGIDPNIYGSAANVTTMGTYSLSFVGVTLAASQGAHVFSLKKANILTETSRDVRDAFLVKSRRVMMGLFLVTWTLLSIYLANVPNSNSVVWILAIGIAFSAVDLGALVLKRKSIWAAASGCPWLANTDRELLFTIDSVLIVPAVLALIAVILAA